MQFPIVDTILGIVDKVAGITKDLTNGDNRGKLLSVKIVKDWKDANDIAEKIFIITDKLEMPEKKRKAYDKLRKRFNKND